MFQQRTPSYADSVNRHVCDEFSADLQLLTEAVGAVPQDVEREFSEFFADLKTAAAETRQLIAEIEAITT